VEVMNFLAAHPTESFKLSELAARLGLSNGSAHRVLNTLAEARYLSRHPKHKTYSLGMALVAIGQAALAKHRDIEVARRELARLAKELKVQCMAATVADGELLLLASEGTPQTGEPPNHIGERRPFMPPLGMAHAAWLSADLQSEYLSRAPAALNDSVHERLGEALQIIRQRGYSLAGSGPAYRALRLFTSLPVGYHESESYWAGLRQLIADLSANEIQMIDLAEAGPDGIAYITAPVFSPSGEVILELSISGMSAQLGRTEIEHHIERLRAAAAIVTSETHGRLPPDLRAELRTAE
jgi:DNA-binding IclR family transcriptional regulator